MKIELDNGIFLIEIKGDLYRIFKNNKLWKKLDKLILQEEGELIYFLVKKIKELKNDQEKIIKKNKNEKKYFGFLNILRRITIGLKIENTIGCKVCDFSLNKEICKHCSVITYYKPLVDLSINFLNEEKIIKVKD